MEVMALLSKKWADMSNYKKSYYKQMAAEKMAEYKKTMNNLSDQQIEEIKNQRSQKRKDGVVKSLKKELNSLTDDKPKKAVSGYNLFMADYYKGKKGTVTDLSREAGSAWKEMNEVEKERYNTRSQTFTNQYKDAKNAWDVKISEDGRKERIVQLKLDIQMKQLDNQLAALTIDKPKGKKGNATDLIGEAGSAWKEIKEVEKERYNTRSQTLMDQYKESMAEWKDKIGEDGREEKIDLVKQQIKKLKNRM